MKDDLYGALVTYDGKSVGALQKIESRFRECVDYPEALIELFGNKTGHVCEGATWLFKSAAESGLFIQSSQLLMFVSAAMRCSIWSSQLHICQTAMYLNFDDMDSVALSVWLKPLLTHERPFLRAWALDALVTLADQNSDLRGDAFTALEHASHDPVASVQARVRNLRKSRS